VKQPAVYIMANRRNGTLYTGVTSNLVQRAYQHRESKNWGRSKIVPRHHPNSMRPTMTKPMPLA